MNILLVRRKTKRRSTAIGLKAKITEVTRKFIVFGIQQALCCIFPVAIFITLAVSKSVTIPGLARYDFILIICLLLQICMVLFRLENFSELKVICLFHIIGLCLELYKIHMGSWSYPESAIFKIGGVPLYSGFMYASVASYICQSWKRLHLRLINMPKPFLSLILIILIYANFFTHHFTYDMRWILFACVFVVFFKSKFIYTICGSVYKLPVALSFLLIGFFIWIAENISTFFNAWQYPHQAHVWQPVHIQKISSWFLLVIISIMIVAELKRLQAKNLKNKTRMQREH